MCVIFLFAMSGFDPDNESGDSLREELEADFEHEFIEEPPSVLACNNSGSSCNSGCTV